MSSTASVSTLCDVECGLFPWFRQLSVDRPCLAQRGARGVEPEGLILNSTVLVQTVPIQHEDLWLGSVVIGYQYGTLISATSLSAVEDCACVSSCRIIIIMHSVTLARTPAGTIVTLTPLSVLSSRTRWLALQATASDDDEVHSR